MSPFSPPPWVAGSLYHQGTPRVSETRRGYRLVQMEDPVDVRTGEEDETCVFRESAQLFEFEEAGWKGRGRGILRINRSKEGHKARLLMKGHSGLHLLLNANLWSGMVRLPPPSAPAESNLMLDPC